jgi:U3 small nucleolar RNA-associated protein 11
MSGLWAARDSSDLSEFFFSTRTATYLPLALTLLLLCQKIERLRGSLHGLATTVVDEANDDDDNDDDDDGDNGAAKKVVSRGKHTVFVDDEHAVESFDPVKFFDTVPEAVNRTYNRPRKSQLAAAVMTTPATISATTKQRIRRYEELAQRGERLQKMERMKQAMLLRRHLSAGGRVKLVKPKGQADNGVAVYRWSKERKK